MKSRQDIKRVNDLASARRVARSYGIKSKAEVEQFAQLLVADTARARERERMAKELQS